MKRLVVFCDGTWNKADKPAVTNVCKLRDAVDRSEAAPVRQHVHYEEGVGTLPWEKVRGGMFGMGLSGNVRDCYAWLVEHYEPGDELFFFGFSRGAFTARSLAGLVRNSGILRREHGDKVKAAYKLYRSRKLDDKPSERAAKKFRDDHSHPDAQIAFIGVWDTVGALGIPIDGFRPPLLSKRWTFHDTTLSGAVLNAYHAIAIDERRRPFEPTLWVKKELEDGTIEEPPKDQNVEQVWFAGVHSDVGGGYPDPALSEIPLLWIADRAVACGLVLKPGHLVVTDGEIPAGVRRNGVQVAPDPHVEPHDSLSFLYRRVLKPLDRELRTRDGVPINPLLASTVKLRRDYDPPGLARWRGGDCEVRGRATAPGATGERAAPPP